MNILAHRSLASIRPILGAICLLPLLASPAAAQGKGKKGEDGKREAYMQMGMKLQQIGQQLQEIQKRALDKNPALKKKQAKLRDMVSAEMKKNGVDPDKLMEEASSMRDQAQKPGLSDAKRKALTEDIMQRLQRVQQAQMDALQKPKIKKVRDAFQKEMEAAMIKTDPKAKKLLAEFNRMQDQMNKIISGG